MSVRYLHMNIVGRNFSALSKFYQEVFGCVVVPPFKDMSVSWEK